MKQFLIVALPVAVILLLAGVVFAYGPMAGGRGWGMMGPGMTAAPQVTEEKAKELAQQYAQQYLPGFAVERLLPFGWMGMTMYQAELKGPKGEVRILHVNPWGNVMPFGGPMTR